MNRPLFLLLAAVCASEDVVAGLRPVSFDHAGARPVEQVRRLDLPELDGSALLHEEDETATGVEKVLRVAVPRKVGADLAADGTFDRVDRTAVWRVAVRARGALWLAAGFGTFRAQPGVEVWVYTPDGGSVAGPFTDADIRAHGQLWVPPLPGDTLIVEVDWTDAPAEGRPNVHLGEVLHGVKTLPGSDFGGGGGPGNGENAPQAGACNIDVNCPLGDNWQDEKRGVVNLLNSGGGFCTGSLITNVEADCKNYVLTAAHCLSSQSSASGTIFQFNFERPGCGSGVAPTNQQLTGSFLRATYSASDFTLLEMDDAIPEEWNPYYNGWSRDTAASLGSHCIHHPNNDEKKISYNDDLLLPGQNWGPDHWRVDNWEQGTTEPGSSGSPLFDAQSRIVGQLHGGTASCSSITYDEFGKVDVSWNGGGTSASRLRDWLDPANTGAVVSDGIDGAVCRTPQPRLAFRSYSLDDSQGNGNGVAEPGELLVVAVETDNRGTLDASGVTGVLSSPEPLVSVGDPSADWPIIPMADFRGSLPPHFTLSLDESYPCGAIVPLDLDYTAAEAPGAWASGFEIPTGTPVVNPVFQDQMEAGANGWIVQTLEGSLSWNQTTADSSSPTHSWFVSDISTRADAVLVMPALAGLPAGAELRFRHRYNTEANYDGGVLEYSTNGGGNWLDAGSLLVAGNYNGSVRTTASSNLAGRSCWAGDSGGWMSVTADLSSLAGTTVQFRWRFATDTSVSDEGWYVDDVVVDSTSYTCEAVLAPPGEVPAAGTEAFRVSKDPGGYRLTWSPPASGGAADEYRLYRTALGGPVAAECEADLGAGTSMTLATLSDDRGFLVVARNGVGEGDYGEDSTGTPRSPAAVPCP